MRYRWFQSLLLFTLGSTLLLAWHGGTWAGDWPGWRGPTGLGYTDEKELPLTWDGKTGKNVLWKTLLHGGGKNNPDAQCRQDVGPLPRGDYRIGAPIAGPSPCAG